MLEEKKSISRSKKPTRIEYWIKRNPDKTREECESLWKEYNESRNYQNSSFYKRLHPEWSDEQCEEERNRRISIGRSKIPDNRGENNPSHHSKTTERQRKERSVMCIEYWEKHYPDLSHEQLVEMMNEKKKSVTQASKAAPQPTQIRYWTEKGYSEEEAKLKVHERQQTFSLEKCIKKYGEEKGLEIFKQRQEKWKKSLRKHFEKYGDGRSPQSFLANSLKSELFLRLNIDVKKKEKFLTDSDTGKHYAFDFDYGKKLIEINGDYWHCNPKIYKEDYFNNVKQMFAKEIWKYDSDKIACATKNGYKVLTVWESECNEDFGGVIQKCIDFLTND